MNCAAKCLNVVVDALDAILSVLHDDAVEELNDANLLLKRSFLRQNSGLIVANDGILVAREVALHDSIILRLHLIRCHRPLKVSLA